MVKVLDDKNIDAECLEQLLIEFSKKNSELRQLSINNNQIGDRGCMIIQKMLPQFPFLELLYLSILY